MDIESFIAPCSGGYNAVSTDVDWDASDEINFPTTLYKQMTFTPGALPVGNVTDALGDKFLSWNCRNPVLIDAPTGSGKTTFVCKKLIPQLYLDPDFKFRQFVSDPTATLLLVSNRVAISQQQKRKILDALAKYEGQNLPSAAKIDDYKIIGRVCICTYQGLPALLSAVNYDPSTRDFSKRLKYAVFDETHFFYSDATFNETCGTLLTTIPVIFQNAIRIYMTATSWSIRNSLLKSEKNVPYIAKKHNLTVLGTPPTSVSITMSRTFLYYRMPGNYDRYNLNFFSAKDKLGEEAELDVPNDDVSDDDSKDGKTQGKKFKVLDALVKRFPSPSTDNKLLIFINSKESGNYLAKKYAKNNIPATFIDSSCRMLATQYNSSAAAPSITVKLEYDGEFAMLTSPNAKRTFTEDEKTKIGIWNKLINEERFDTPVLISTPVLDCGVNIHDDSVKTIVVFSDDPTTFMQMMGRKRFHSNEEVDLAFYSELCDYVNYRMNRLIKTNGNF